MMKKFLKYFIVMPLLVIIGIYALNAIIFLTIWYFGYVRVNNLSIVTVGVTPVKIDIPVKFSSGDSHPSIPSIALRTKNRRRYALRCIPEKNVLCITACDMGWFINVYSARYEVTDPKVRAKLIELFKKARQEEEELIQRERAKIHD